MEKILALALTVVLNKGANYLQINLAKYNEDNEDSKAEYLKWKQFQRPLNAWATNNSEKKELRLDSENNEKHGENINIQDIWKIKSENNTKNSKPSPSKAKSKSRISLSKASEVWDKVLISKWIDYTSKYGIGYKLSNNRYGVLFNDSTKLIVAKDNYQFYYLGRDWLRPEENGQVVIHTFNSYPIELKKKVILTQHFISYLMGEKFVVSQTDPEDMDSEFSYNEEDVYLK